MEQFNFYQNHAISYFEADRKMRDKCRAYWEAKHGENVRNNREDLIIFSSRILADISIIEAGKYSELFKDEDAKAIA